MASVVVKILLLLLAASSSVAFYVIDRTHGDRIYYFSETDIKVNLETYHKACLQLPWKGVKVTVRNEAEQLFLFESYSGSDSYLIGHFGPLRDGEIETFIYKTNYSNFENESAAMSGDFGIAYIDFPNNWWKVAPLMTPRRMRYICEMDNPCTENRDICGSSAQCVFNTSSGWFYCKTNATRCEDDVTCLNGGSCLDQADGYMCQCPEDFTGKHCEYFDGCKHRNLCENGGTCYNRQIGHIIGCRCTDAYHGGRCQYQISSCYNDFETCGGYQCIESRDRHSCLCPHPVVQKSQLCVSSEIQSQCWIWTDEIVSQLSQFVRPYVNINGSMACGCDDDDFTDNNCAIDVNECASNPCQNNGYCVDKQDAYECYCVGHFGNDCQYREGRCDPDRCEHGGTCHYKLSFIDDERTGYREWCNCDSTGYTGGYCHIELDECQSGPCLHNGRCVDQMNAYSCNCSGTGYVGARCDINAEHCPEDEAGQRCARDINECESSPCRHGSCIDELLEYHCDCSDTGYEGTHCDIDIDECASNPCNQGNCTDGVNYFTCVCFAGYDGKRCDVISDNITVSMKERQSMNATPYVVASVLLAVCLVTVVVLFILRHRHKSLVARHKVIKDRLDTSRYRYRKDCQLR